MITVPYDASRAQSRGVNTPIAIVLHEVNEPLGYIDAAMQLPANFPSLNHQSYHYAVDASAVHAYIPATLASHAIADMDTMAPWSVALAHPGVDPDLYTVNVAVSVGVINPMPNPCTPACGRTFPITLQRNLQTLLNQIGAQLGIDITSEDVVWKHGTELCDLDLAPLLLAVPAILPPQNDFLCDQLADLPPGTGSPAALVGADCKTYTPAQISPPVCTSGWYTGNLYIDPAELGYQLEAPVTHNLSVFGVPSCAKFVVLSITAYDVLNEALDLKFGLPEFPGIGHEVILRSNPGNTLGGIVVVPVSSSQITIEVVYGDLWSEEMRNHLHITVVGWF